MIVLRPASSASSSIWRSCRRSYLLGDGSAVDQSTQVFTVLNPRSLIFFRSSRQTSRCLSGSGSSIGARAFPPPYHTANGKKGSSPLLRACSFGKSAGEAVGGTASARNRAKAPITRIRKADGLSMSEPRIGPESPGFYLSAPELLKLSRALGSPDASDGTWERIITVGYQAPGLEPNGLTAYEENPLFIYAFGHPSELHGKLPE